MRMPTGPEEPVMQASLGDRRAGACLDQYWRVLVAELALRPIEDSDLDALFEQMRDPESVRMAAFTTKDPDDRAAFEIHMAKVRTSPEVTTLAVTADGRLVGSIACFVVDGDTEITYWIDRSR